MNVTQLTLPSNLRCQSRDVFLELLPILRNYAISQAQQLPHANRALLLDSMTKQLPWLVDYDDNDMLVTVVGYIVTTEAPYMTFWEQAMRAIRAHYRLMARLENDDETEFIANAMEVITIMARAYLIGFRVYDAARTAHRQSIPGTKLVSYWADVKV